MKAICIPIRQDRWYTSRIVGWKILDFDSGNGLAEGSFLNPLKKEVQSKHKNVQFIHNRRTQNENQTT